MKIVLQKGVVNMEGIARVEAIESKILWIRGKKIMLDVDLARLYEVPTKVLNQAVRRNIERFPSDFMFRLTDAEKKKVVTICDHLKNLRFSPNIPHAFTEQGVAMLSSVLNSKRAILVNIQIMRVFVNLKRVALTYVGLKRKIDEMEKKYDEQFLVVFEAIKKLIEPPEKPRRMIGFRQE